MPRASNVEGRLKRNIEDGANSVLVATCLLKGRMNNKVKVQLHQLELDERSLRI